MLFEVLGHLPEHLDPATRLGLIWEARAVLARAVKEERRTTADQASLTPRIMRYAIETANAAQPPPPPPPQPAPPAPIAPPEDDRPPVGPRHQSSARVRQSFRITAGANSYPAREDASTSSAGAISSAIDRIFQAEIHSNVSGIPSPREATTQSRSPAPPESAVPGDSWNAPASDLVSETTAQAPVGHEPADVSKTNLGG